MDKTYNYSRFTLSCYDFSHFPGPKAGERFPLETLPALEKNRWSVIETVSLTCPMYARHVSQMNKLAKKYPFAQFLNLYVREGHPGERTPQHRTAGEKQMCAERLDNLFGEKRKTVVDTLQGDLHQQLGFFPNMLYIVRRDGIIAFRGDWAEPRDVERILETRNDHVIDSRQWILVRVPSPMVVWKVLRYGGWLAIYDFVKGLPGLFYHMILKRVRFGQNH